MKFVALTVSMISQLGERLFTRQDCRPYFEAGCIDIIQPDISHAGGISETRRIANMAETYDIGVAPHCPLGEQMSQKRCIGHAHSMNRSHRLCRLAADCLLYAKFPYLRDELEGELSQSRSQFRSSYPANRGTHRCTIMLATSISSHI